MYLYIIRADSRFAPSQWETSLQSNTVSHWRGASLESTLHYTLVSQSKTGWKMTNPLTKTFYSFHEKKNSGTFNFEAIHQLTVLVHWFQRSRGSIGVPAWPVVAVTIPTWRLGPEWFSVSCQIGDILPDGKHPVPGEPKRRVFKAWISIFMSKQDSGYEITNSCCLKSPVNDYYQICKGIIRQLHPPLWFEREILPHALNSRFWSTVPRFSEWWKRDD